MRLTVGPLPPAVYWRRRALVLGAILLVLFLVAQACMAASASPDSDAGGAEPTATTSPPSLLPPAGSLPPPSDPTSGPPDPTATEDADPEPSGLAEDDLGEAGCTDDELLVVAEASPTTISPGGTTTFTMRYQNSSDRTCQRDIGPGRRELFLRAGPGSPPLWSSRDCQDLRGSSVQELAPGIDNEHFIDWRGRGSDTCDGPAAAGDQLPPGDYQLIARVGTAHSEPVTITVSGQS